MPERQLRLDGSVDLPDSGSKLERNKDGSMPAKYLRAVKWYMKEHGLTATAANAHPVYYFRDEHGGQVIVNMADIVQAYEAQRETKTKRKVAS